MNKKEQVRYFNDVKETLQRNNLKISWILDKAEISRSHWFFLKKGSRPLIADTKLKIDHALSTI